MLLPPGDLGVGVPAAALLVSRQRVAAAERNTRAVARLCPRGAYAFQGLQLRLVASGYSRQTLAPHGGLASRHRLLSLRLQLSAAPAVGFSSGPGLGARRPPPPVWSEALPCLSHTLSLPGLAGSPDQTTVKVTQAALVLRPGLLGRLGAGPGPAASRAVAEQRRAGGQ